MTDAFQKANFKFEKNGRSLIDMTILLPVVWITCDAKHVDFYHEL